MKKLIAFMFFAACVIGLSSVNAFAQNFSADVTGKGGRGDSFKGKMFMQDGNVRMEMGEMITITRPDKKVVWMLMPTEHMYMEQPITPRDYVVAKAAAKSGNVQKKLIGNDMINGKSLAKYQVTYPDDNSSTTVYEWMDSSFDMPVKMAAIDDSWSMEYNNIKVGAQAAALFEIPAGYQKFAMPNMAAMMGRNN